MGILPPVQCGPLQVNTWIVPLAEGRCLVVDPAACSVCGDSGVIDAALKEKGLEPAAVILTHGHFDHVSGLSLMAKSWPDAKILIHREDAFAIGRAGVPVQEKMLSMMGMGFLSSAFADMPEADFFLEDGKSLFELLGSCGAEMDSALKRWKVLSTPGHSDGSVCLYNAEDKVLISGDTLFYRSWGRTDFECGSEAKMKKSLERLYDEIPADARVYPGHGEFGFTMGENVLGW